MIDKAHDSTLFKGTLPRIKYTSTGRYIRIRNEHILSRISELNPFFRPPLYDASFARRTDFMLEYRHMAGTKYRIVSDDESEIYDKFHFERSRVTVRQLHVLIEEARFGPSWSQTVTDLMSVRSTKHSRTTTEIQRRCDTPRRATAAETTRRMSVISMWRSDPQEFIFQEPNRIEIC